jgi:hypothetical protein
MDTQQSVKTAFHGFADVTTVSGIFAIAVGDTYPDLLVALQNMATITDDLRITDKVEHLFLSR